MRVPAKVKRLRPGAKDGAKTYKRPLMYGTKGEEMEVKQWIRWPSYDFIFAVPAKTSRMWKDERGFFQYRDARKGRHPWACYFDLVELRELVDGFTALLNHAEAREKSAVSDRRGG